MDERTHGVASSSVETGYQSGSPAARGAERNKEQVKNLSRQAKDQARGVIEEQKSVLAERVSSIAKAVHASGEKLDEENEGIARYVHDAASTLDRVSSSIRDRDFAEVQRDVESFARRRPGLFLGGCVAAGFALSRFLKSSSSRQEEIGSSAGAGSMGAGSMGAAPIENTDLMGEEPIAASGAADMSLGVKTGEEGLR